MKNILTEALVNSATNASFIFSYTNSAKLREEANEKVQNCTEDNYNQMVSNLKHVQYLINNGYFTKKLFVDTIMALD